VLGRLGAAVAELTQPEGGAPLTESPSARGSR
jgi:hypothetical protein